MRNLLLLNASTRGEASVGLRLAHEWVERLTSTHPQLTVTRRDLAAQPLAPLSADYATALTRRTPALDPVFVDSQALIAELERCELLLIATPMHNFTVPAALKLWIDHVVRIGRTFSAGPDGKVGLLADRPVYLIISSGGFHRGERARQPDFMSDYLRHVLLTLGLHTVHFIYLEGLAVSDAAARDAYVQARHQLAQEPLFDDVQAPNPTPSGNTP